MIICRNCSFKNPEGEYYCLNCSLPLVEGIVVPDTVTLGNSEGSSDARRHWGTARFDKEDWLILTVRGFESDPLVIRMRESLTLGRTHRGATPDIDLTGYEAYDQGVSRVHALLTLQNDTLTITDLGSSNSTFLNGQKLQPDQPRIVRDGDEVRLGQLVIYASFRDDPNAY